METGFSKKLTFMAPSWRGTNCEIQQKSFKPYYSRERVTQGHILRRKTCIVSDMYFGLIQPSINVYV